jgi:hypothetical protein
MANLAFNQNGMLSKPKPMQPGMSPPIAGPETKPPMPGIGGLGGSPNDIAPAGVMTRPPAFTDRIIGKPTLGSQPPGGFGGMIGGPPMGGAPNSYVLPTDPNSPGGGMGERMRQMQGLFGGGMPSGGMPPQGAPQFGGFGGAPGPGGMSAPAPQLGGGMTATMDPRLRRRPGFDPGLR